MSLVICPECKEHISENAAWCSNCGVQIKNEIKNGLKSTDNHTPKKVSVIIGIMLGVIIGISIGFSFTPETGYSEWEKLTFSEMLTNKYGDTRYRGHIGETIGSDSKLSDSIDKAQGYMFVFSSIFGVAGGYIGYKIQKNS